MDLWQTCCRVNFCSSPCQLVVLDFLCRSDDQLWRGKQNQPLKTITSLRNSFEVLHTDRQANINLICIPNQTKLLWADQFGSTDNAVWVQQPSSMKNIRVFSSHLEATFFGLVPLCNFHRTKPSLSPVPVLFNTSMRQTIVVVSCSFLKMSTMYTTINNALLRYQLIYFHQFSWPQPSPSPTPLPP